jgi:hypothetical protein
MAANLHAPPADLRSPASFKMGASEADIAGTIEKGISIAQAPAPQLHHAHHERLMPSFSHLTERERRSIALYVLSLRDN